MGETATFTISIFLSSLVSIATILTLRAYGLVAKVNSFIDKFSVDVPY